MPEALRILFLAAEAVPFIKIGDLANLAGSLPLALRNLSLQATAGVTLDVRLVLPLYRAIRADMVTLRPMAEFSVTRPGGNLPAQVFESSLGGTPVYFIKGEPITNAASVYSPDQALDHEECGIRLHEVV